MIEKTKKPTHVSMLSPEGQMMLNIVMDAVNTALHDGISEQEAEHIVQQVFLEELMVDKTIM